MTPEVLRQKRRLNGGQSWFTKSCAFRPHAIGIFIRPLTRAVQKSLQAFAEFCLWQAKAHAVRPATLWQGKVVQNRKPNEIAPQFWRVSAGLNPIPIDGSEPPASAASAFAGHATGGFAAQPDFADSSYSGFRNETIGNVLFLKVRNSERRFPLLALAFSARVVTETAFFGQ